MARRIRSELALELSSRPRRLPRRSGGRAARVRGLGPGSAPVGSTSWTLGDGAAVVMGGSPLVKGFSLGDGVGAEIGPGIADGDGDGG